MLRSSSKSSSQLIQQKLLEVKMHSNFAVPPSKLAEQLSLLMSILCDGTTKASSPNTFMRWKNCRYAVSIVQFLGTTRQENILHCLKKDSKYYTLTNRQCRLKLLRPHPFLIGLNLYSTSFQWLLLIM